MAVVIVQPWRSSFLFLLLVFFAGIFPLFLCQSNSPQNIETFYPAVSTSPEEAPSPGWNKARTIATAVAATAVGTMLISGLLFFLIQKCLRRRRKGGGGGGSGSDSMFAGAQRQPAIMAASQFSRPSGNLKGFIVEENGLDVIYWRKLESRRSKNKPKEEEEGGGGGGRKTGEEQEIPLFRGESSSSDVKYPPEIDRRSRESHRSLPLARGPLRQSVRKLQMSSSAPLPSPALMAVSSNKGLAPSPLPPPPPPPPPEAEISKMGPPPSQTLTAVSENKGSDPPPPPISANKNGDPSTKTGSNPPPPVEESSSSNVAEVKEKPLEWDRTDGGSIRFDGDIMEALFGSVATNRKSPGKTNNSD